MNDVQCVVGACFSWLCMSVTCNHQHGELSIRMVYGLQVK